MEEKETLTQRVSNYMKEKEKEKETLTQKTTDLTLEMVKQYICPMATNQEAFFFLQLCRAQKLNPFIREVYLIKYGNSPAQIVVGKETFTKRAEKQPDFEGYRAGIVIINHEENVERREGTFFLDAEVLLGGWAEVYKKERLYPYKAEIRLAEYIKTTKEGKVFENWEKMPATMIRKVALVQALREAFPDTLGGMYSQEEMSVNSNDVPSVPINIEESKGADKGQSLYEDFVPLTISWNAEKKRYEVKSLQPDGSLKVYWVTKDQKGKIKCTCTEGQRGKCKHLEMVKEFVQQKEQVKMEDTFHEETQTAKADLSQPSPDEDCHQCIVCGEVISSDDQHIDYNGQKVHRKCVKSVSTP